MELKEYENHDYFPTIRENSASKIKVLVKLNELWKQNSKMSFGKIISIVIGCLNADYYSATINDWIDAILKSKNNKIERDYQKNTYYIYPGINGYIGVCDKLNVYTDYIDEYRDAVCETERRIASALSIIPAKEEGGEWNICVKKSCC